MHCWSKWTPGSIKAAVDGTIQMRFGLPHPLRRSQCSQRDAGLHVFFFLKCLYRQCIYPMGWRGFIGHSKGICLSSPVKNLHLAYLPVIKHHPDISSNKSPKKTTWTSACLCSKPQNCQVSRFFKGNIMWYVSYMKISSHPNVAPWLEPKGCIRNMPNVKKCITKPWFLTQTSEGCNLHSLKLTGWHLKIDGWKTSLILGKAYFQVRPVGFKEGKL